jgi:hypothetical protein
MKSLQSKCCIKEQPQNNSQNAVLAVVSTEQE